MRILSSDSNEKFYLDEEYYYKLDLFKIGNHVYKYGSELPKELEVTGNLSFQDMYRSLYLPKERLKVNGSLKIFWSKIVSFPSILHVSRSLEILETYPLNSESIKIKSLVVNGNLCRITYSKIEEISSIFVKGDLNLESTKIRYLPKDLQVKGDLMISYTKLKDHTFHNTWQVGGTLYCSQEQFEKNFDVCKELRDSGKVANFIVI